MYLDYFEHKNNIANTFKYEFLICNSRKFRSYIKLEGFRFSSRIE